MKINKKAYAKIINILIKKPLTRRQLISAYIDTLGLSPEELADKSTKSRANVERSTVGSVITEMLDVGLITRSEGGLYSAADQKPIVIRNEKCAAEILKMLKGKAMGKAEIKKELVRIFGTDKTVTERDDNKLFTYMNESLRGMVERGVLVLKDGVYSHAPKTAARIDDISSMLALKNEFLSRLHRKGGEFFEVYFMNLLERYVSLYGKTVVSCSTTGGSADGGIDGIMESVDCLGFRETVMVQTKNKIDPSSETDVRGFYGAVCARGGTRGIFATSSEFHSGATDFLNSIDNCVGVDGDKLFEMAMITHYGIKKSGAELSVDDKII